MTGGSGFLGSHVADELSNSGHKVTVFDKFKSPYIRLDQEMLVGDILDSKMLNEAVAGNDIIYHFAGISDIAEPAESPKKSIEANIMGTLNILEASRSIGIKRLIFASSIYVYSNQGSFYRTSKQTCERLIENYNEIYGLDYTVLRFGSLYGPRADETNTVYSMISSAVSSKEINCNGTGKETREYIHVKDGALAAVEILDEEFNNTIIHLTGQEKMTHLQMMAMISEILDNSIKININSNKVIGHYFQTPYSCVPKLGQKLVRNKYIDIGLGLLDLIDHQSTLNKK